MSRFLVITLWVGSASTAGRQRGKREGEGRGGALNVAAEAATYRARTKRERRRKIPRLRSE
jgi:hypothetical protein